ncbi:Protein root UVB sensitive 6 [Stylosanthes scabra]|uniref:Protein root UVB sensitive 6 n=1 Tax=Stylosanthes scabra TaxID=79078 RepID=A0ABU6YHQ0_9FABA|nr:Protein root UVB sensitive 6 [Stylosanthes scabra]
MAPINLNNVKQSAASTTTTIAASSQDILVRETLRISANLASSPLLDTPPALTLPASQESTLRFICCEEIDGRRWNYVADADSAGGFKKNSFRALTLHSPQAPLDGLMSFVRSYVVPEGFPDSVTPSYVPYMTWRALKHFFGGAMGVFTTQTLLSSVGVSRNRATPGAVAINWILKDGAGRVGKMLFARQGKKFDYDLKQLRFAGDLLMELGAGVELATAAVPHLFLPLACAANVAKNVAAVTSTSTRTPIYKAFAKGENIGDVTAKGECVGNIADLLGTGLSIWIAKRNPSLVKSVVLHTLNSARFSVAVDSFIKTGRVPTLCEGNMNENIFSFPWKDRPVVLGSRVKDAFQDPSAYVAIEPLFDKEKYIVTYNPSKCKAHVLLNFINSSNESNVSSQRHGENVNSNTMHRVSDLASCIADSCKIVTNTYGLFKNKANEQGWAMSESLLNPGRARLCQLDDR